MTNGQIFKKVMANSPGGILADTTQGQPPVFISAGLQDDIFPIQQAGNAVGDHIHEYAFCLASHADQQPEHSGVAITWNVS